MPRRASERQGACGRRAPAFTAAVALLALLTPFVASAASLYSEDFSYANGSALVPQGGWNAHSSGGTNPITVATPGLTFAGYAGSGIGNMVTMAMSGEDDDHSFTSQTSGAVYAAFLVNVQSATTTGDYFLHLMVSPTATLFYCRVYVKKDAANNTFGFGVRHSSAGTIPFTPTTYAFNQTHLIVIKYQFNGGSSNDVASLWVDPPLGGSEPAPTLTHSGTDGPGTDATAIAGISLRQGSSTAGSTQQVDGLRVGTAWSDVAGSTNSHTITASAGVGGTIAPSGAVSVADGGSQSFTITANSCFSIADVQVDGVSQGAVASYAFTGVTTDHTIAATFAQSGAHTIAASAGAGGAIAPSGNVSVSCGTSQSFTITPDGCHAIADVQVDGGSVGAVASYGFTNVNSDHTIAATFSLIGYALTATAGTGGTIAPSGDVSVGCGGSQSFTVTPDACHTIADVAVDGSSVGPVASYGFTNVGANHTIAATFAAISYTITATANTGGSITPSGAVPVTCGASQSFTMSASAGYALTGVTVDGGSVGAVTSYTFTNVTASHTIDATFTAQQATVDVGSSAAYLCPSNACVTLPVTLTRNTTEPVLAFSVAIQLSPNLSLCSGTSSIAEGSFLSASGPTLFHVIDLGGGLYEVDDATTSCGPTATSGVLFTVGVASSAPGGTGSVTITTVKLRDCANQPLPVNAGSAGSVPIDNQAPSVSLTSPMGGEVWAIGTQHAITWTASDNSGVASIDLAYSTDGGATYPHAIASGLANSGSYNWTVPNGTSNPIRVQVTAHDVACSSASAASGDVGISSAGVVGGPVVTELAPVVPTPSRGSAVLSFGVGRRASVDLAIYSVDGRRVKTLASGVHDAGRYQAAWDGRDETGVTLHSGVFYARLVVGEERHVRAITLVR